MTAASLVDSTLTIPISILLTSSAVATILFLFFLRKSKALYGATSENLCATIFDKTFNVFDVYPKPRKMLLNYVVPLFGICVYGTYVVGLYIVARVLQLGLIISLAVLIVCIASIAVSEAFEINSTANAFLDAMRTKRGLGKGDVTALLTVRDVLPRISLYYLLVAILFGALGLSLPITFPLIFSAITNTLGHIVEFAVAAGHPFFYVAPFLIAITAMLTMFLAGKIKGRILNLSVSNTHTKTLDDFFIINRIHARWLGHHEGFATARLHGHGVEPDEIKKNEDEEQQQKP